jgi:hypothetical protein
MKVNFLLIKFKDMGNASMKMERIILGNLIMVKAMGKAFYLIKMVKLYMKVILLHKIMKDKED